MPYGYSNVIYVVTIDIEIPAPMPISVCICHQFLNKEMACYQQAITALTIDIIYSKK